jgi:F-type H+-transporting ATPase subunit c
MEIESARLLAKAIATLSMAGSAIGEGYLFGRAFEAMGRNPEISDSLFTKTIVAAAITESTAIYAFVAFFII